MRALFARHSRGVVGAVPAVTPLRTLHRCVFIRELTTPVLLENRDSGAEPFPARLLWQYNSQVPRHVVLHLRPPGRLAAPKTSKSGAVEDSGDGEEGSAALREPAAYLYGRLFLRPYNVAQLLTVLQGWSSEPVVIARERATLTLAAAVAAASPTSATGDVGAARELPPGEVTLTATLTRKVVESPLGDLDEVATARAVNTSAQDLGRAADEHKSDSVYVDGSVGTVRAVLRDADVVLLTSHLESVLRDLFRIEHHYHETRRRAAQAEGGQRNYTSRGHQLQQGWSQTSTSSSEAYAARKDAYKKRPQYRSQSVSHAAVAASAAPRQPSATAAAATPPSATPPSATPTAADDEYDVVEEVEAEEVEEVAEDAEADTDSGDSGAAISAPATTESAAASTAARPNTAATAATTYKATRTQEKGEMTMESDAHYAEGRFIRDGSVSAAVVEGVSRIGDFDVRHRTREAQGATETDRTRTTTHATASSGAFRSTGGEVSGTFSYERIATVTEADTAEAAGEAAAAAHIPVHRDSGEATMEVRATKSEPSSAVAAEPEAPAEEDVEESAEKEAATPARKSRSGDRNPSAAAGKKKKAGKKKPKKAPAKRKAPAAKPSGATTATAAEKPPAASPGTMDF